MPDTVWRLQSGEALLGVVTLIDIDQPWFRCHFEPADSWGDFAQLFETLARVVDEGIAQDASAALKAVHDLDLRLIPEEGVGEVVRPVIIQIRGDRANFRY
ncbi:hypothetical protein [Streptomyces sp. 7N604]|uniref:hypothetical protein n=1 Tax=Streptomyces sp. 7N604 TaxID=3457415 RepID=UPI003FD05F17